MNAGSIPAWVPGQKWCARELAKIGHMVNQAAKAPGKESQFDLADPYSIPFSRPGFRPAFTRKNALGNRVVDKSHIFGRATFFL